MTGTEDDLDHMTDIQGQKVERRRQADYKGQGQRKDQGEEIQEVHQDLRKIHVQTFQDLMI